MICGAIGRPASITASGSALSEADRSTPAAAAGSSSLRRSTIRRAAPILALLYLGAHIWFLPPALEDIDSINFALALHDFDPVLHRPHPPGYPVYVAMGKVTRPIAQRLWPGTDAQGIDAKTLGLWSAAGGAIALVLLVWLVKEASELSGDEHADLFPLAIAMMLGAAPLFWMSGLRPLSDMPGLAAAIGVQAALLRACRAGLAGRRAGSRGLSGHQHLEPRVGTGQGRRDGERDGHQAGARRGENCAKCTWHGQHPRPMWRVTCQRTAARRP